MKKIWIIIIISVIIIGIGTFFYIQKKPLDIYTYSYDGEDVFLLGPFLVCDLNINGSERFSDPITTFYFSETDEEKQFISSILNSDAYRGETSFLYPNNYNYIFYLLKKDGYQYVLYKDRLNRYVFQPLYSKYEYTKDDYGYTYRFLSPLFMYFNNINAISNEHNLSINDFLEFYENIDSNLVEIDYENSSIKIKGYDIIKQSVTENYVIELIYHNDILSTRYIGDVSE